MLHPNAHQAGTQSDERGYAVRSSAISIGERGKVDLPFMAQLLGTPGEYDAIQAELRGVIFKDPMAPGCCGSWMGRLPMITFPVM